MNPLYRADTYLCEFVSPLAFARPTETGATALCLRDLAFFPGGGGQPKETIGCFVELAGERYGVADLVKEKGDVLIVLDRAATGAEGLKKGEPVRQVVDSARRLTASRLHTGQHVLGAAAKRSLPGYESRGMRLADDLSGGRFRMGVEKLPDDAAQRIAQTAADALEKNLPVRVDYFPSVEAVRAVCGDAFRVDPSLTFQGTRLRTVVIGDAPPFDGSLCGGTHVRSLAEVGGLEITDLARDPETDEVVLSFRLAV